MAVGGGAGADLVRRALSGVLAVFAGLVLVGSTSWWWDLTGPVPVLQSLYPVVPAVALIALLCAWVARAWRPMGVIALALVVCGAALIPTVRPRQEGFAGGDARGPTLRVMSVNTLFGQVDLPSLVREIDARDVDLLILTEAGPQFTPFVSEGGIGARLPFGSGATAGGAAGTLILSRLPMRVIDRDDDEPGLHQQPIVEVTVGAPGGGARRSPTLAQLAGQVAGVALRPGKTRTLAAGRGLAADHGGRLQLSVAAP